MEEKESILVTLYKEEDGEYFDGDIGDVEMLDAEAAETMTGGGEEGLPPSRELMVDGQAAEVGGGGEESRGLELDFERDGTRKKKAKKNRNRNRKKKRGSADFNVTDINRFVINTCRHLKEKKSYLVWNAVGCLGVSAVSDLVKEVDAIQACGGQQTADGKRFRFGGGILWNILKTREPKAYKEIMAKGREFEKQFKKCKAKNVTRSDEEAVSPKGSPPNETFVDKQDKSQAVGMQPNHSEGGRVSVLSRIRAPIAYDDLFEEGEIV